MNKVFAYHITFIGANSHNQGVTCVDNKDL